MITDIRFGQQFHNGYIIYFNMDDKATGLEVQSWPNTHPPAEWQRIITNQFGYDPLRKSYYFYESNLTPGNFHHLNLRQVGDEGFVDIQTPIIEHRPPLPVNDIVVDVGYGQFTLDWRIGNDDLDPSIDIQYIIAKDTIKNLPDWKNIFYIRNQYEFTHDSFGNWLRNGQVYQVYLRAVNSHSPQDGMGPMMIVPSSSAPPVQPVVINTLQAGANGFIIHWAHNNWDSVNRYEYRVRQDGQSYGQWREAENHHQRQYHVIKNLLPGKHIFQMRAVNNNGSSKPTNESSVLIQEL